MIKFGSFYNTVIHKYLKNITSQNNRKIGDIFIFEASRNNNFE